MLNLDLARQDIEMPRCDILWSFLGMQNACGTPEKLQRLLCRAWDSLSDGGVFLGAIPNGTKIIRDLGSLSDRSLPFAFEREPRHREDEQWYNFTLLDAYEQLPEAVVSPTELERLAEQIGFQASLISFADYVKESSRDPSKRHIYTKILGREQDAEWATHLAKYYVCFALKKPHAAATARLGSYASPQSC
ncbi:uncharacterized protein PAN0_140d6801 [Moesziomyces antarcticus]|uniref:Uncharacterized protein n=2 Tax=Pseudozyma antarctica TaxID=84753 RepID=A0A5C3FY95_PSEA2|nr:uncharacterized protein PAN0_140d6801 [Moesziomyces antarcticus]GAK68537.1 conserved hypothetical protein [Moesziomyces antarcticus]SPO49308.1 uncharacterized protein PSANT_07000 [Moesziomyces antarcticus]